jgi:hypothetical protein
LEAFFALRSPEEFGVFLEEIGKRFGDFGEVLNEATAVTCQTKETTNLLDVLRRKPIDYGFYCLRISSYAFRRNDMP